MRRIARPGYIVPAFLASVLFAQTTPRPVTLQVEIVNLKAGEKSASTKDSSDLSNVVVWLTPIAGAAVVAVDTPYFGISDRTGRVIIPNVPESRYLLSVWYERSLPADLKSVSRVVTISDTAKSLEAIRVIENTNFTLEHKNKYGQDYVPPASTSPSYKNP